MRFAHFAAPIVLVLVTATPVRADDAPAPTAKELYAQGVKLHKQGDHLRAAESFAHADELTPTPIALRAALDQALLADDPVLAMTLADRASRAPNDAALRERAAAVRARFGDRAGRVNIRCAGLARCLATIDGASAAVGIRWVRTGQHTIVAQLGEEAQQRLVDVRAGDTVEVAFKPKPTAPPVAVAPPPTSTSPAPRHTDERAVVSTDSDAPRGGVSPVFFFVGAALTAGAGAATIVSGLDTRSVRDDFVNRQCDAFDGPGCSALSVQGIDARTRTNVLAVSTGVLGVATAVIGLFFVRWSSDASTHRGRGRGRERAHATARVVPTLGSMALDGSF